MTTEKNSKRRGDLQCILLTLFNHVGIIIQLIIKLEKEEYQIIIANSILSSELQKKISNEIIQYIYL